MFRHSLLLSLVLPLIFLLVLLMFAVSFDLLLKEKIPELRFLSVGLIGLIASWLVVSFYFQIRRRVLNPLRDLRRKLQRVRYDRLESMAPFLSKDEVADVVAGYNQMVSVLSAEREERVRLERERILQSQLAALGLQADGLVHELATPLSAISTMAKLAADGDQASAKALAMEARALTERLKRFMNLFRDRKVAVQPILLSRIVQVRIRLIPHDRVKCEYIPVDDLSILSDEILLSEILDNLLRNAERHAKSKVLVETVRSGEEAWVTVSDDGNGIPPKYMEKLFRPFFTTSESGHGLGLFISKLWSQALGGQLVLYAPVHPVLGGASFRIVLPVKNQN